MTDTTPSLAEKLTTTAVEKAPPKTAPTIFDQIKTLEPSFKKALPAQVDAGRFVRVATTTIRTNKALQRCTPQSLLGALMVSAQLGLEPGTPLGQAYLVPYGSEVTFIIGYRGLIELAMRSGRIASIRADAVYVGDEFTWELGLNPTIVHKPYADDRDDANKITHVYAVARFTDGTDPSFVVLTRSQVDAVMKRSKASGSGPWKTDWEAMALKTAVRRLAKWLPLTIEAQRAVALDERVIPNVLAATEDEYIDVEEVDE